MDNPMSTFKNLLSKDAQNQLKEMSKKPSPSPKKPIISQKEMDDQALFAQAMHGVTPLQHNPSVSHPQKTNPKDPNALFRRASAEGAEQVQSAKLSDMQALLNPVSAESFLSYKNPTLQNKVFEQLKQGKLRWYDAVDLHGASIDDAREAVLLLINNAKQNGETVVKIVHGKGTDALLKTYVNGWLRQISDVMAFVSAPPKDGGNGAVLVLIKKKTTPN
ncbi:MAG: Smr/MutS family protein [Moraxella sp.]|uniref:Smr/MutS family protein n=1 Tax=Moraxella sp. TaxID=479 RepID=UPI0026DC101A|nr:Smr/MutS family protein [Moraxella sp.]MDO4449480.1 Smr/MutS family protein [Moraxella sp.]